MQTTINSNTKEDFIDYLHTIGTTQYLINNFKFLVQSQNDLDYFRQHYKGGNILSPLAKLKKKKRDESPFRYYEEFEYGYNLNRKLALEHLFVEEVLNCDLERLDDLIDRCMIDLRELYDTYVERQVSLLTILSLYK